MLACRLPVVALALVVALAACGRKPPPSRVATGYDLPAAACLEALRARGVAFEPLASLGEGSCRVQAPVRVHHSTAAMARPLVTSCALALALHDYERRSLQPRAAEHFRQPVARIHHLGSHACRPMTGTRGRPSVHAVARAVDIAAFELQDGRVVRVERHWRGRGPKPRFLRDVARDACGVFSVTLTPRTDRFHQDHFHLDLGPWARCDA
jgi:hypothetical protein